MPISDNSRVVSAVVSLERYDELVAQANREGVSVSNLVKRLLGKPATKPTKKATR